MIQLDTGEGMDLSGLFSATQIHTSDDGVHTDDDGNVYDAVTVNGELTFVQQEEVVAAPWPYRDADQNHPLAARRVPVISGLHPSHMYEVALCVGGPEYWPTKSQGVEPTPVEADVVVAAIDYRMRYYRESWAAKMRQQPLDTDSSTNTLILMKRPDGGWCFRRASWTRGPVVVPNWDEAPITLPALLDRIWAPTDYVPADYAAWKIENAGILAACDVATSATEAVTT